MAAPNYAKEGFTAMRVELDGGVAVATLTRSKEYVPLKYIYTSWMHLTYCA